jgi:hypothetical protein
VAATFLRTMEVAAAGAPAAMPVALQVEPKPAGAARTTEPAPPSGMAIGLNALSEQRRRDLASALERLARRLDRSRNPLFVDIGDSEEQVEVERLLREAAPVLTAATALTAARWTSSEGDLRVRAVARCVPNSHCYPLSPTPRPTDELEGRVRFLAWPISHAVLLSAPSDSAAARLAEALRAGVARDTLIALALPRGDLHRLRPSPALSSLIRHAAHIARLARDHTNHLVALLDDMSRAIGARDALPWLRLPPGSVLVVPRLSALANIEKFVLEVKTRTQDTAVAWSYAPGRTAPSAR